MLSWWQCITRTRPITLCRPKESTASVERGSPWCTASFTRARAFSSVPLTNKLSRRSGKKWGWKSTGIDVFFSEKTSSNRAKNEDQIRIKMMFYAGQSPIPLCFQLMIIFLLINWLNVCPLQLSTCSWFYFAIVIQTWGKKIAFMLQTVWLTPSTGRTVVTSFEFCDWCNFTVITSSVLPTGISGCVTPKSIQTHPFSSLLFKFVVSPELVSNNPQ